MDDFVLFAHDKDSLWYAKTAVENFLHTHLKLKLHEGKCRIFATEAGTPFLGQFIFKTHRKLKRGNIIRCKRKLRLLQKLHESNQTNWRHIHQSIQAWIGYAKNADTYKIRELVLKDVVFRIRRP